MKYETLLRYYFIQGLHYALWFGLFLLSTLAPVIPRVLTDVLRGEARAAPWIWLYSAGVRCNWGLAPPTGCWRPAIIPPWCVAHHPRPARAWLAGSLYPPLGLTSFAWHWGGRAGCAAAQLDAVGG
jgi:hypothetical protein